jgi:hypothetical protein
MNSKKLLLALAVASTLCTSVLASEIYRYTDDDGNVVYLDRPTGEPGAEHLNIASKPTNNDAVQASVQARRDTAATAALEKQEQNAQNMTRSEKRAAAVAKQQQCESYRAQLSTLSTSRRLYRADENGERVYLDESQSQAALNKIQALISENCG